MQITRIFKVASNSEILIITPYQFHEDLIQYYHKILEILELNSLK